MLPEIYLLEKRLANKGAEPALCPNCGSDLSGPFCSHCGQRVRRDRFTLRAVVSQTFAQAFSLDRGLMHTVLDLFRRPAKMVAEYIEGRTVSYTPPVKYFLLWVTIAQIAALWTGSFDSFAEGWMMGGTSEAAASGEAEAQWIAKTAEKYYVLAAAGLVPLLALWTRLLFRGKRYYLAEHLIFHLFATGQFAMIGAVGITTVALPQPIGTVSTLLIWSIGMGLYVWSCALFFGEKRSTGVLGMLVAGVLSLIVFMLILAILIKAT